MPYCEVEAPSPRTARGYLVTFGDFLSLCAY
jgi:hypothetical protein